jgi:hypothetical protein
VGGGSRDVLSVNAVTEIVAHKKKNPHFDWKSLSFKRGPSQRKKQKLKAEKKSREKGQAQLFRQLQKDAKGSRAPKAPRMSKQEIDDAFTTFLRENPRAFPGDLTATEIRALRKLVRAKYMSKKKRSRKKRNSRKGKMPAGLAAYWRKKRAAKNPRKKKRAKRRNPKPRRARRRKPVSMRVRNYRKPARRRRRRNPPRKKGLKIIKTNLRKGTKAFKQFVRETRAKYGSARVL